MGWERLLDVADGDALHGLEVARLSPLTLAHHRSIPALVHLLANVTEEAHELGLLLHALRSDVGDVDAGDGCR